MQQRWSWTPGSPPAAWWWEGLYGQLRASFRGLCDLLAADGSIFRSALAPGPCPPLYSAAGVHATGSLENMRQDHTWIPQTQYGAQISNSCPWGSPSCWLLFGVTHYPGVLGVPGVPGAHERWGWDEVWEVDFVAYLEPADLRRVRRAYLGVYRLLRLSNPEYYVSTCRPFEDHPQDILKLPREAIVFLMVSLEFLAEVGINQRLPIAPFYAWVGTSARRGL